MGFLVRWRPNLVIPSKKGKAMIAPYIIKRCERAVVFNLGKVRTRRVDPG